MQNRKYTGAVIIDVHHPPCTAGMTHGGSPRMLQDLDEVANAAGFWPHAVFSGHAHNYQRFTRTLNPGKPGSTNVVYMVAGNGGHGLSAIRPANGAPVRVLLVHRTNKNLQHRARTRGSLGHRPRWTQRRPALLCKSQSYGPLIAIEVLSEADTYTDLRERASDLETMGVRNIWLLDPQRRTAEVWRNGNWQLTESLAVSDSPVYLDLTWLWRKLGPQD